MDVGNLDEPCKSLCVILFQCVWFDSLLIAVFYDFVQMHITNGIKATMVTKLGGYHSGLPFNVSEHQGFRSLEVRDRCAKLIFMIFESPEVRFETYLCPRTRCEKIYVVVEKY